MYMRIEQDDYWVIQPSAEEVAALKDMPRRKELQDKVPHRLLTVAIAACVLTSAIAVLLSGSSLQWVVWIFTGLTVLVIVSAIVFLFRYDYRAPLKKLVADGRAYDLGSGLGWSFVNRVLFVGDRHLDGHRQRRSLHLAHSSLIDAFWQDKVNHELLRRYESSMHKLAKQLLLEVLGQQARLIIEDLEQYVAPFRAAQAAEDAEAALRENNSAQTELTGVRRFLLEEGLLPNG